MIWANTLDFCPCCPISYSRLVKVNSHCVHQWAFVLAIILLTVSHSCTHTEFLRRYSDFHAYPLVSRPSLVYLWCHVHLSLPPPPCALSMLCQSEWLGAIFNTVSSSQPIKPRLTGNSIADPAVREWGEREGYYTSQMCTMQLCQESQPFSNCAFTLTGPWQILTLIQGSCLPIFFWYVIAAALPQDDLTSFKTYFFFFFFFLRVI